MYNQYKTDIKIPVQVLNINVVTITSCDHYHHQLQPVSQNKTAYVYYVYVAMCIFHEDCKTMQFNMFVVFSQFFFLFIILTFL